MKTLTLFIPNAEMIEAVKVGDNLPDCFGKLSEVVEIRFRGVDVKGKAFVGVALQFGENSTITDSYKEGELHRSANLSRFFTSVELKRLEADMLEKGESHRTIPVPAK